MIKNNFEENYVYETVVDGKEMFLRDENGYGWLEPDINKATFFHNYINGTENDQWVADFYLAFGEFEEARMGKV